MYQTDAGWKGRVDTHLHHRVRPTVNCEETMLRFSDTATISIRLPQIGALALTKPAPLSPSQRLSIHYLTERGQIGDMQSPSERVGHQR